MTNKVQARAAIVSVTLINFNGMAFVNLDLDSGTTALEGGNGAGKTTTMVGCYLPLMPDQAYLRFKNITDNGDHVKSDGSIYDRFGAYSDVCYSVLKFRLGDGSIFYAGVEVQKRPQRKYELTPFTIADLPQGILPEEFLMVRDDAGDHCIAPLSRLGPHIISMGGGFRKYAKLTDYFGVLFEHGISPTILTTATDRAKLHKLMMASFYGGLTGDLQKSIKDYLLPENNDVKTAVERARVLLNEVRLTKQMIERAQATFRKVQLVDSVAFEMMSCAFYSTRNEFDLAAREKGKAMNAMLAAIAQHRRHKLEEQEVAHQWRDAVTRLEEAQGALAAAQRSLDAVTAAHRLAGEIATLTVDVEDLRERYQGAEASLLAAQAAVNEAEQRQRHLIGERVALAETLGNARAAFQSISRKVGLYRAACSTLDTVRSLLGDASFQPEQAAAGSARAAAALREDRDALEPARRALQSAEDTKAAFAPVHTALAALVGEAVAPDSAWEVGCETIKRHRGFQQAVDEANGIESKILSAEQNARRQKAVRDLLASLTVPLLFQSSASGAITTVEHLRSEIAAAGAKIEEQSAALAREAEKCAGATRTVNEKEVECTLLEADFANWKQAAHHRKALLEAGGGDVTDRTMLGDEESRVEDTFRANQKRIDDYSTQSELLERRLGEIQDNGSRLDDRLGRIADLVDGRLVAELHDDVQLDEAARVEAQLGPLVEAIIVRNVRRAAATLSAHPENLGEVWLIAEEDVPNLPKGEIVGELCLVGMGKAVHVGAVPDRPVLGRAARQAEMVRLQAEIDRLGAESGAIADQQKALKRQREAIRSLMPYVQWLDKPSPEAAIAEAAAQIEAAKRQIVGSERRQKDLRDSRDRLEKRLKTLNTCNMDANLIEGDDWAKVAESLREQQRYAAECQRRLAAGRASLEVVSNGVEVLRAVPPSAEQVRQMQAHCERLEVSIRRHNQVLDGLARLIEQADSFAYADQVELEQQEEGKLGALVEKEQELARMVELASQSCERLRKEQSAADAGRSDAYAKWSVKAESLRQRQVQLDEMDCPHSAEALQGAADRVAEFQGEAKRYYDLERELLGKKSVVETRRQVSEAALGRRGNQAGVIGQAQTAARAWRRASEEWRSLSSHVEMTDSRMSGRLLASDIADKYRNQHPGSLSNQAERQREALRETLSGMDAAVVLAVPANQRYSALDALADAVAVRKYLEQSLPRDITQADDIGHALSDITAALEDMRQRQVDQEGKFRTNAESISNNISNLVRREIANINRINNDRRLSSVRFGSITGVQIHASRIEHMNRFLDALRVEDDLFTDDRSLEEALAFLYQQSGGGSAQGADLLDYRKYIQVSIQVTRLGHSGWDANLGSSSGESIGVGAAILVVILDAMERQSEALQRRKIRGSIRFLMLDEANRLDSNSLEMMSGFCSSMGVQLLVAAPEIARARSGTTYCLVRRAGAQGQEVEVAYRGRRGFQPEVAHD